MPNAGGPMRTAGVRVSAGSDGRDSARGLVGVLRRVDVVLGDDGEPGLDLRGGLATVEGQHGLVQTVGADGCRLLGNQGLNDAVLERLDLVGTGVEADDLDLVLLACL